MAHHDINSFDLPSFSSFLANIPSFLQDSQTNTMNINHFHPESKDNNQEEDDEDNEDNNDEDSNNDSNSNYNDSSSINSNDLLLDINNNLPTLKEVSLSSSSSRSFEEAYPIKLKLSQSASILQFNSADNFKLSALYRQIERCCISAEKMQGNKYDEKYDIESDEGNDLCKETLEHLESLFIKLKLKEENRDYRLSFSNAYLFLYRNKGLCYLPEILDNAQEGTPFLIVNGEKFCFSQEVLEYGLDLYETFSLLLDLIIESHHLLKDEFLYEEIKGIKKRLAQALVDFDRKWVLYEKKYINELIYIEQISRRYIFEGIRLEKELTYYELKANVKGKIIFNDIEYNRLRENFIKIIIELNKVANIEGKGRDDLTIDILLKAERVLRQISDSKSKGMRKLGESIKQSLFYMRTLFRKYDEIIETIDPQLRNNQELVDSLYEFEMTWEKGKDYLIDENKYNQLLSFSQTIEVIKEKYSKYHISELIDSSDPMIFLSLPSIIILQSLVDPNQIEVVTDYIPDLLTPNEESEKLYRQLQEVKNRIYIQVPDNYGAYNLLEKFVLFDNTRDQPRIDAEISQYENHVTLEEFRKNIKMLSLQLQRYKPCEWNVFFQLAMDIS